jgi:imidazoleglycerol-phosphate dehydratase
MRISEIKRKTNETDIQLRIDLDGSGLASIDTGIGFYDHMLNHVAVHGLFDLKLKCEGDLEVDPHHTVEDCALVLGQAIDQALSDRKGINRMGSMYVPMDETLGFVAVDLSGRPFTVFQGEWHSPSVGGIDTSLIPHFFESLAVTSRSNIHARVLYGQDDHHQVEALFKALGRALNIASRIDPSRGERIASTKGSLT